ncbi:MAG: hypothetical protein ACLTTJ_17070 [Blautia sp.]
MAWKACLWARLGDGERALKLLKISFTLQERRKLQSGRWRNLPEYALCTSTISD